MSLLERTSDEQRHQPAGGDGDSPDALNQARSEAGRMLAAGDQAIRRALAGGNSEAFLRSAVQQGGQ